MGGWGLGVGFVICASPSIPRFDRYLSAPHPTDLTSSINNHKKEKQSENNNQFSTLPTTRRQNLSRFVKQASLSNREDSIVKIINYSHR